jgi:hypothetical protein
MKLEFSGQNFVKHWNIKFNESRNLPIDSDGANQRLTVGTIVAQC